MLQSMVSSRVAGQAAPPNCGCWTMSLARVFLPPPQDALQSLVSLQPPTSQSTRQNTFNVLPPTMYQNLVKMVIMMDVCQYIRIFWFHWPNYLGLFICWPHIITLHFKINVQVTVFATTIINWIIRRIRIKWWWDGDGQQWWWFWSWQLALICRTNRAKDSAINFNDCMSASRRFHLSCLWPGPRCSIILKHLYINRSRMVDKIYTHLFSDVPSIIYSTRHNDLLQSSRSKAEHPPGKTLCNPFKDLRNAGFVDAMHQNTGDKTMMDPPGQTLAAYQFQALHNVSLFFRWWALPGNFYTVYQ